MNLLARPYPRRLVTVPALHGVLFLLVTTLPLWVLAAAFLSPLLPGRWRQLRLLAFAVAYLALQAFALAAAAALWLAAGFGRNLGSGAFQRRHCRLRGALLAAVMHAARRAFHLRMVRIVLTDRLQWDPAIDVLLHRVPTRFISPVRAGVVESIRDLAQDMGPDGAVVIFPEGANFTPARRQRAIDRLQAAGLATYAGRARRLKHLMAPRPAGALAAIDGAPGADVVFVAHCGLEQLSTVRDLWRDLPMDSDVRARLWTVAAEDVPSDAEARVDWLFGWWERLDAWIHANRS